MTCGFGVAGVVWYARLQLGHREGRRMIRITSGRAGDTEGSRIASVLRFLFKRLE